MGGLGQVLACQTVLEQTEGHTHSRCGETNVEAVCDLQPTCGQRANESTNVDAHVEDGETSIAAVIVLGVEAAH